MGKNILSGKEYQYGITTTYIDESELANWLVDEINTPEFRKYVGGSTVIVQKDSSIDVYMFNEKLNKWNMI